MNHSTQNPKALHQNGIIGIITILLCLFFINISSKKSIPLQTRHELQPVKSKTLITLGNFIFF
jgi:hypothetical protein